MYDRDTATLIRATPSLKGLDRQALPDLLTKTFAQIAAARIRLRDSDEENPEELASFVEKMRRLAYTNEALVSVLPQREDRSAAAFVAATVHQLCFNADSLFEDVSEPTFIGIRGISNDIAAMLLFMVAEATADASEVSKTMIWRASDPIEEALIASCQDLASGQAHAPDGPQHSGS